MKKITKAGIYLSLAAMLVLGTGTVVGKKIPLTKKGFRRKSEAFDLSGCGGRI